MVLEENQIIVLLEKEQEKYHASVSESANFIKRVTVYLKMQPAEVTCMVVVTTGTVYCSQSTINSFNFFQGPYLQNIDLWEVILWSQETKVNDFGFKTIQNVLVLLVQ